MSKSLVIPSAGYAKRIYPLSANKPKVLIELNGVPIFHLLYQKAVELKMDNIIIAINPEFERQLKEFINFNYKNAEIPIYIEVVDNPSAGVLYSVYKATSSKHANEKILLMLSDTLYTDNLPVNEATDYSFMVYKEVKEQKRWCLIETDLGIVKKFWDKPQGECPTYKALIGVYYFKKKGFNLACYKTFESETKIANEYQLSQAFEEYLKDETIYAIECGEDAWHDTGTLENLRKASMNFFVSRSFNHIKIEDGYLIKESENKKALRNQYMWFHNLNEKYLCPTIYGYEEGETEKIKMELCSMPDLGTLFNFCQSEPVFFTQTIQYILKILNKAWYQKQVSLSEAPNNNIKMLCDKTKNRFAETNYETPVGYYEMLNELLDISLRPKYSKIHGDLILSNILFDPQRMTIKLIDPRGEYGESSSYGDVRYDLAKMLHSLDGRYESIINNLFRIEYNEVIFYSNDEKDNCFKEATKTLIKFAESNGIPSRELYIIEASLFLSMLPLHASNMQQQKAFYLTATRILRSLYE